MTDNAPNTDENDRVSSPSSRSAPDDAGRALLSWSQQRRIRAVVFDANAFGGGVPDLAQLEHRARELDQIGIETWIPEPVAWEWAEHLSARWTELSTKLRGLHAELTRGRVSIPDVTPWVHPGVEAIAEQFLVSLGGIEHVRVLDLRPDSARAALRDQILVRPPAKLKKTGKTGASDSAWMRDVIAEAGSVEHVVLVTTDGDIHQACKAWGQPEPLVCKLPELSLMFNDAIDDDGATASAITRHLVASLPTEPASLSLDAPLLTVALATAPELEVAAARITSAEIVRISEVAGLRNTKNLRPLSGTATAEGNASDSVDRAVATAYLLAEVNATGSTGGEPDQIVRVRRAAVLLTARLEATLENGEVREVYPVGPAGATVPTNQFESVDDALVLLKDSLGAVPGLDLPDSWPDYDQPDPHVTEISGTDVSVTVDFDASWGEWYLGITLETPLGEHHAALRCRYDLEASSISGTVMYPPYMIEVVDGEIDPRVVCWSTAAWVTELAYGPR